MTPCRHSPGTTVEIDPDVVWSTCTGCAVPIWRLYDPGDEDRVGRGWGAWRPAPMPVNAAAAPLPVRSIAPAVQGTARALRPAS